MDAYTGGPQHQPDQPQFHQPQFEESLSSNRVYSRTFLYFGLALLITGASALLLSWALSIGVSPIVYYVLTAVSSIGIFILSIYISFRGFTLGNKLIVPYILYSVFMGILLSGCSYWVGSPYIFGLVLCLTSALFLLMCGIGLVIGKHVGILGTLLIGGLIGAGIMGLVSFFTFPFILTGSLQSLMPMFYVGEFVFLFVLLLYVAIDMFALKRFAESNQLVSTNMCIFFALRLYSDFISILIRVLRLVAIAMASKND